MRIISPIPHKQINVGNWGVENQYFFTRNERILMTKILFFCSDSSVSSTQSGWEVIMECYNNRGRFLIEAILWWLIIALPINLASIFFSIQAPAYIHTDHINNGTNDFNTSLGIMISYSKIQFAVFFILLYRIHWMVSRIFYNYESKTFARNWVMSVFIYSYVSWPLGYYNNNTGVSARLREHKNDFTPVYVNDYIQFRRKN